MHETAKRTSIFYLKCEIELSVRIYKVMEELLKALAVVVATNILTTVR